ncbi:MAG: GNAT family N-acetyltransferase, partial [Candidatus Eiseniibacteriota bacterium]
LHLFAKAESALARLLELRGYERVRTFLRMTIELASGYPEPFTPSGIDITPFRRGLDERDLHDVIESAFADHFRFAAEPHDEWVARRVGHPEFDGDLWLLAREGETVVGGILPYPFGDLGWVRELGVRDGWRGRGIGKALLLRAFHMFQERGRRKVSLGVDAANAWGAIKLYEDIGMFVEERHDLYRLPVRLGR